MSKEDLVLRMKTATNQLSSLFFASNMYGISDAGRDVILERWEFWFDNLDKLKRGVKNVEDFNGRW